MFSFLLKIIAPLSKLFGLATEVFQYFKKEIEKRELENKLKLELENEVDKKIKEGQFIYTNPDLSDNYLLPPEKRKTRD